MGNANGSPRYPASLWDTFSSNILVIRPVNTACPCGYVRYVSAQNRVHTSVLAQFSVL
jgi:hypothetical protein